MPGLHDIQPSSPAPFLRPHHVLHSPATAVARQRRTTTSPLLLHIPAACVLDPQRGSLGIKHCAIANLASAHHVNSLAANQLPRLSDSTHPMQGCPAGTLLPHPLSVPLLMVLLTTINMAVVHCLVHQPHTCVSPWGAGGLPARTPAPGRCLSKLPPNSCQQYTDTSTNTATSCQMCCVQFCAVPQPSSDEPMLRVCSTDSPRQA